jgi:hypothetical protein
MTENQRAPAAIERVWIVEIQADERTILGNFNGPDAEAQADARLRQLALGLESSTDARNIVVHAWVGDLVFFCSHQVRSLDTDEGVRGKIVHVLQQMLDAPAFRLVPSMTEDRVRALIDEVAGIPNVVLVADRLREVAAREMRTLELQEPWEDGMAEYFAELACLLRLAYPAPEAVDLAHTKTVQEINAPSAAPVDEAERADCLMGIEAAWNLTRSLLNLEVHA